MARVREELKPGVTTKYVAEGIEHGEKAEFKTFGEARYYGRCILQKPYRVTQVTVTVKVDKKIIHPKYY